MYRLASILFSMIATTLMGIGIIAVLSMGYDTLTPILLSAAVGFIVSIPATWIITKQIRSNIR